MKYFYIILFIGIVAVPVFTVSAISQSVKDDVAGGLGITMNEAGLEEQKEDVSLDADAMSGKMSGLVGSIMNIILGTIGAVFLTTAIYAGFIWMTSGGNDDSISKAKSLITASAIGMLLVLSAYIITDFVIQKMVHTVDMYEDMPIPQEKSLQLFNPALSPNQYTPPPPPSTPPLLAPMPPSF